MCWEAVYRTRKGSTFKIVGTQTNECPISISYFSPKTMEMVQMFSRTATMYELCGASLYGGDLNRWPARTVDAFTLLQAEVSKVDTQMLNTK